MIFIKKCYVKEIEALLNKYSRIIITDNKIVKEIKIDKMNVLIISSSSNDKIFKAIKKLYNCYEFSNKIMYISNCQNFGEMTNYISTGLLTIEEFTSALLQ